MGRVEPREGEPNWGTVESRIERVNEAQKAAGKPQKAAGARGAARGRERAPEGRRKPQKAAGSVSRVRCAAGGTVDGSMEQSVTTGAE